jgi:short-subunit dehydrogenase
MKLQDKKIILTGAYGGIGKEVASLLLLQGASVILVGRQQELLNNLVTELSLISKGVQDRLVTISADITNKNDRLKIINDSLSKFGNIDILINLAGLMSFTQFSQEDPETTEKLFQINVLSPMHLSKMLIPHMINNRSGHIVNIGSIFGSISFAWFTTYSSTKFALRGFSEALRRELDGTGIEVSYIAPRAVRTAFNSDSITQMCNQFKTKMDSPSKVAKDIVKSIQNNTREKYLGFPEKIFVCINALFPRLIDKALKKQNKVAKQFTNQNRNN